MRILYNNLLDNASLSATNENPAYPVENIVSYYLEKPFKATGNSSVITCTLDSTYTIDCVGYGYHNFDTMNLKFKDSLGVEITNFNVTLEENETIYYFSSAIDDVKTIEITLTTISAYLMAGAFSFGEYLEMPVLRRGAEYPIGFRGSSSISGGGQASGNRRKPLRLFGPLNFPNVTNAERQEIETMILLVQDVKPHFIDIWPDAHTSFAPFYGKISGDSLGITKKTYSGYEFDLTLEYTEVR